MMMTKFMTTYNGIKTTHIIALAMLAVLFLPATAMADCSDPAGKEGEITFNDDYLAFQGCSGSDWISFHNPSCPAGDGCIPDPCAGSPTPGTTCADGTIYVNDDGGGPLYTTAVDEAGVYQWKTVASGTTGTTSDSDGAANTDAMAAAGLADHPAAEACRNLGAAWYLPAIDELSVLYANSTAGDLNGTFAAAFFWSSTENAFTNAKGQSFADGTPYLGTKNSNGQVRCVRR